MRRLIGAWIVIVIAFGVGCKKQASSTGGLSGVVSLDGSSTVFPISEAVAEEFQKQNPGVRVTVGLSGTGGGFKRFSSGETDINNASRPIKPEELAMAAEQHVGFIEIPVGFDGITVAINPQNTFVDLLTVQELKKIWEPNSAIKTWRDIRANWPANPITLYGPGTDSGTFDYFTETVVGKAQSARNDFTASEDDNVLVHGVAGDSNALGFFGFAYYVENRDKLKAVAIDGGAGPVTPTNDTIIDGTYQPLSRPLFLYVRADAAKRPEVAAFIDFYLTAGRQLVKEVGYSPLPDSTYNLVLGRFRAGTVGTMYTDTSKRLALEERLTTIR